MLRFFNTLSRQVEEFQPLEAGKVRMYMCGPTVWNFAHIGNFRTFIFGDVLRRYLKYKGYELTHVFNLTDVDDRIINEANTRGISIDEFTAPYIQYFWEDFDALGNERPDVTPRATEHIAEMIDIIAKLLANDKAYESDGSIYYRIAAFPEYGKLSKISFEGNIAGGSDRVDTDKYDKEDARDFALWKLVGPDDEPGWDAPFGRGRPGWHIECSAMSMKYLGETFDLHAGGMDLQFPHHENEIAQSEGSTGKLFSKYWIHSEFLKIDDATMSKSKGNFFTFRDLRDQGYSPLAMRYLLLSVPYRKQLNFTFEGLQGAESTIERLRNFRSVISNLKLVPDSGDGAQAAVLKALTNFNAAMDDDFNTAAALAAIHDMVREVNTMIAADGLRVDDQQAVLDAISQFDSVLGIFGPEDREMLDAEIESLIEERQAARQNRDFARSDEIRDTLTGKGIILEDTKDGVPLETQMSRLIDVIKWGATLGSGEQNFLGARWVRMMLKHAPAAKRREYALKILSLSPHYFLDADQPQYKDLTKREYVEDAFLRARTSREKIYDQILKERLSSDDVVLDYGCGPGFLARVLAGHVKQVYALDISRGALACARILNDAPNLGYLVADADGFAAVPNGGVDAVVSIAMVQHVSDEVLDVVFENCRQKLRPEGQLIMHVHLLEDGWKSEDEWKADQSLRGKVKYKYGLHCFGRRSDEYKSKAAAHGFEKIDIQPITEIVREDFDDICSEHLLTAIKA